MNFDVIMKTLILPVFTSPVLPRRHRASWEDGISPQYFLEGIEHSPQYFLEGIEHQGKTVNMHIKTVSKPMPASGKAAGTVVNMAKMVFVTPTLGEGNCRSVPNKKKPSFVCHTDREMIHLMVSYGSPGNFEATFYWESGKKFCDLQLGLPTRGIPVVQGPDGEHLKLVLQRDFKPWREYDIYIKSTLRDNDNFLPQSNQRGYLNNAVESVARRLSEGVSGARRGLNGVMDMVGLPMLAPPEQGGLERDHYGDLRTLPLEERGMPVEDDEEAAMPAGKESLLRSDKPSATPAEKPQDAEKVEFV